VLCDRRAEHIRKILKLRIGDTVRVGIVRGPVGSGVITALDGRVELELRLGDFPPPPIIDLLIGLPRPIMLKRVLAQAAAMGVDRIWLVNASRVEKSFFQSTMLTEDGCLPYLYQGLEQGGHTHLPDLHIYHRFRMVVDQLLPELAADNALRLVGHPAADLRLWQIARPPILGRILLAIGPEGGWTAYEISKLEQQGFLPFTMGEAILRVDTAVPALLGQLSLLRDWR